MIRPVKAKRLDRLQRTLDTMPVREALALVAFFCKTGDLPDERRVAAEVTKRALLGSALSPLNRQECSMLRALGNDVQFVQERHRPQEATVRDYLFDEAVYGPDYIRKVARIAIRWELDEGIEVTDPQFGARHGMPEHGSMGMHVLGYPQKLARPPYVEQAERLFERFRQLRDRIPQEDPTWWRAWEDAEIAFHCDGVLPADELLLDVVLANAEMDALWDHRRGEDVRKLMAALDGAAKAPSTRRKAAIAKVQACLNPRSASRQAARD